MKCGKVFIGLYTDGFYGDTSGFVDDHQDQRLYGQPNIFNQE
jgi:hypothetical protein